MRFVVFWEKKYLSYPRKQGTAGLGEASGAKIKDEANGSSRLRCRRGLQDSHDSTLQTSPVSQVSLYPSKEQGEAGQQTHTAYLPFLGGNSPAPW